MLNELSTINSLQLNSLPFLLLSLAFLFLIKLGRYFRLQGPFMAFANLAFLYYFIANINGFVFLSCLLACTYSIAEIRRRGADIVPRPIFLIILLGFWACLFLVKDPNFASFINPFHHFPVYIVGISFMLFRCINYIEDAELSLDRNFLTFLNYMTYFPTFIMGPIERYDNFIKFYNNPQILGTEKIIANLHRIANGFIKKFVFADNLYFFTTFGSSNFDDLSLPMLWIYILLQLPVLYMDFSGYCDIVIGLSRLLGIPLMENFNKPLKACNIQELWMRWHISLTSFIRDYVFNPLNRFAFKNFPYTSHFFVMNATYFLTMMLIALRHGTSWSYAIYGMIHGVALIFIQTKKKYFNKIEVNSPFLRLVENNYVSWSINFVFISLTMVIWSFNPQDSSHIFLRLMGVR